jgi:YD repeat-containing protein
MGLKWDGRKTWLALFTVVFCVVAVAPALADPSDTSPIPEESQGSNDALGESPVSLPNSEDVIKGLHAVELREKEREEELATPEAQHEREVSRGAYGDLNSAEAQQLFSTQFGDVIAALNNDPARFLSDAKLEHPLGDGSATVTSEGNTEILEAGMPVETKDEDGELGKVDLSLEKTNEGWVPVNPLVDLSVGESAAEGVEVGTEGLAVIQVGAEPDSTAEPLGDKNLWFSEVEEGSDTDLLVSPTSMGVELFDLLRSPASPETINFHLDLPEGAELRASDGGGAEIVDAHESPLALVPSPTAVDAQGSSLPVDMEVNGSSLTVHVEHRQADVAYPILLDPSILQDWYNANWYNNQNLQGLNAWGWQDSQNPHWIDHGTSDTSWPGHSCLCIATEPTNIPPEQWGQYYYSAPNAATYLANAWINPFWRNNRTCTALNPYPQPHDYDGMWNETSWNRLLSNQANEYGSSNIESWGRSFIIGMSNGANWTNIPCWRDLMIGGVAIWLDDWDAPHLSSVTGIPTGWVKKDNTPRTISVAASDEGLGVQKIRFLSPGGKEWNWNQPWCSGTYENRCETSRSGQITFETSSFPFEGDKVPVSVQALDPTEKGYNPWEYTMKLDGTSPTISLSGQLAGITAEAGEKEKPQGEGKDELSLPTYKLAIEAKDGSASEPRSGVKEIKVYLDGKGTPEEVKTQTCPAGSCAMTMNYTLKLPGLAEGKHTLKVVAIDQVGNETKPERKIEFEYIPATGMKEEYVLQHFTLPDGHDYSEEPQSHGPELAVNVMNGNVVYHERDIQVQTRRASMEVERIYNSQLPTEKDTQWGHGWTLAQASELKPTQGESPPQKASVVRTGAITNSVNIPVSESQPTFSSRLHASIDKAPGGSYEVVSETDNETSVFSSAGRIQETRFTSAAASSGSTTESEPATPTYQSSFGATGTANGQFNHPAGSAIDAKGNIWVVDENNKRVEKFSEGGEYLSSFGTSGTGNGQFSRPTDVAIDAKGNLWVTDAGNSRIEQFNEKGEYITKVGTAGSGNLQFNAPESLAIDSNGNIWVGDTYNHRVQELNEKGEFIRAVGSYGSGQGQIVESTGIAVGPSNNVWVADWGNNRITEFSETGTFIRQFGTVGTGPGQFKQPDVIEVDAKGNVWVGDQNNARIQQFNQSGEYVGQFGTAGTGAGQFSFGWPMGISVDAKGRIWISDTGNNRVQKWQIPNYVGPAPYNAAPAIKYTYSGSNLSKMVLDEPAPVADPSLAVNVESGLTSSVSSETAGTASFKYETGKLTAAVDPQGQTKYTYDASGRLKRVELPNGTWSEVTYDTMSRATAVTVDPAGPEAAKTTHFSYSQEPRQTIVWGGGNPEITYSIAEDGSVFKWSYAEVAPAIDSISGSLWANRNNTTPIENKDHTLFLTGSSPHEIGSIQVLVNGNAVVAEKTCEDKSEPPAHNCEHVTLEWVTNAAEHAAGQLNLEVVVTDFLGHSTAERFFVTIPQQPPPDPEAPPRPSFEQIKQFREEFGLDREHNYTEEQMTALILELLYEWELQKPTAMLAIEKWGVPLRSPEVAELEYREQYIEQFAELIPEWAQEHAPTTYGGYYVDNRAGGIIYVGFTANQQSQVEALKQSAGLIAPGQVREYPTPPATSIATVEATEESVAEYIAANQKISQETTRLGAEPGSATIRVGASNPSEVRTYLEAHFGSGASIETYLDQAFGHPELSRYTTNGPINPGDAIMSNKKSCGNERVCWGDCTAGFGARAFVGNQQGQPTYAWFTLTAGHCFSNEEKVNRSTNAQDDPKPLGTVRRYAWGSSGQKGVTDAEAIQVDPDVVSGNVFIGNPRSLLPMRGVMRARIGTTLCRSGRNGGVNCGIARRLFWTEYDGRWTREVEMTGGGATGDSGGPIWNARTEKAVGLVSEGWGTSQLPCHELASGSTYCKLHGITPLVPFANRPIPAGALNVMGLELIRGDF